MEIHIKSSANAQEYFNQGNQFLDAAWRCYGKKNDKEFIWMEQGKFQQLSAPCIVNAAFSCEMFLKALLYKLKVPYNPHKEGHNLYLLFKKLPSNIQETIARYCGNKNDITVFNERLKTHQKDFVRIRYFIERDGWSDMSPITMITIADNLSRICEYLLVRKDLEGML